MVSMERMVIQEKEISQWVNIVGIWIKNARPNIFSQIHVKIKYFPLFLNMIIQDKKL